MDNVKFKDGDTVRVLVQEASFTFPVRTVGVIRGKSSGGSYKVHANNDYWHYNDSILELVKSASEALPVDPATDKMQECNKNCAEYQNAECPGNDGPCIKMAPEG